MLKNIKNLIQTSILKSYDKEIDYSTWIFSSSFNTKFNYNSKYLFEYVIKNEPSIKPLYVINDDALRTRLQKKYGEKYFIEAKSTQGIKQVLKAGVWFTSAGLPVYGLGLNRKRLIVNLWHGVPLKKIALLEENASKFKKIYFKYLFSNNYSFIITTSKKLTNLMSRSFGVKEEQVKVLGQPRNDVLFKSPVVICQALKTRKLENYCG